MDSPNNEAAQFPPPKVQFLFLVWLSFACAEAETSAPAQSSCKIGPSNNFTQILWNTRRCCNSCPPGTHMTKPCDTDDPSTTECSPCDPNTYTEHPNLLDKCLLQYPCREQVGQKTEKQGTATNNFECSCMDGYEETADGHCRRLRMPDKHQDKTTRFHDPPQDGGAISKPPIQPFTTPFTISPTKLLKQPISKVTMDKNGLVAGITTASPLLKPTETKATDGKDNSISTTYIVIIVIIVVPCSIVGIVAIVAIANKYARSQGYNQVYQAAKKGRDIENAYETDEPHLDNESPRSSFISASSGSGTHADDAQDTGSTSIALGIMEHNESVTTLNNPGDNWEERLETEKPKCSTSLNDLGSAFQQLNDDYIPSSAVNN